MFRTHLITSRHETVQSMTIRERSVTPSGGKGTALDLCVCDRLVVRLFWLMHIPQKPGDLPAGHARPRHAPLDQTASFQDNANYDKFHHPALCAFRLICLMPGKAEGRDVCLHPVSQRDLMGPVRLVRVCVSSQERSFRSRSREGSMTSSNTAPQHQPQHLITKHHALLSRSQGFTSVFYLTMQLRSRVLFQYMSFWSVFYKNSSTICARFTFPPLLNAIYTILLWGWIIISTQNLSSYCTCILKKKINYIIEWKKKNLTKK